MILIVCDEQVLHAREAFEIPGRTEVRLYPADRLTHDVVAEADALVTRSRTRVDRDLVAGTRLRFVGTATIGVDHVDQAALADAGIAFAGAPGSSATSVAQFTLAALAMLSVRVGLPLHGATLGVIGCGFVGERVARAAERLGLRVLRYDPPLADGEASGRDFVPREALAEATAVTLHVPLVEGGPHATRGLVDEGFLEELALGSLLVNTARGEVVDTGALLDALSSGQLLGAALDVVTGEPRLGPQVARDDLLLTPHVAGRSLEGMLGNTAGVRAALVRHFGLADTTWSPPEAAPAGPVPSGTLPIVLETLWGLELMDSRLRAAARRGPDQGARVFRELRGAPLRRDLTSYELTDDVTPDVQRFFEGLRATL